MEDLSTATTADESLPADHVMIDLRNELGRTRLLVRGEIDIANAPKLHERLSKAIDATEEVVVDLHAVTFIDSTALGVLVNGRQRASRAGTRLKLVLPEGRARFPFEVTGLAELFDRDGESEDPSSSAISLSERVN